MTAARNLHRVSQHLRWERLQVTIRCGLRADQPALLRTWLGLGRWLVQQGMLPDAAAQQRMLQLLLDTAGDEALPWPWRSACLELADRPLARLRTLGGPGAPGWQAGLALARERLPLAPGRPAPALPGSLETAAPPAPDQPPQQAHGGRHV